MIGVGGALLSVVSLFSDPNLDDPANPYAAMTLRGDQAT